MGLRGRSGKADLMGENECRKNWKDFMNVCKIISF